MEDECSIGNDETRCFILSSYATHKMNKVPCVLCNNQMIIFERWKEKVVQPPTPTHEELLALDAEVHISKLELQNEQK